MLQPLGQSRLALGRGAEPGSPGKDQVVPEARKCAPQGRV